MAKNKDKTKAKADGTVRLDPPDLPLIPGRTATFVAPAPEDRSNLILATITTDRDTWTGAPSVSGSESRVSKIIETGHTEVKVSFTENGKEYASGTFSLE